MRRHSAAASMLCLLLAASLSSCSPTPSHGGSGPDHSTSATTPSENQSQQPVTTSVQPNPTGQGATAIQPNPEGQPNPAGNSAASTPDPRLLSEGADLRLVGVQNPDSVQWAPSGKFALVQTPGKLYSLSVSKETTGEPATLLPVPTPRSVRQVGWTGPDTALLTVVDAGIATVRELSLATAEWRPLATLPGEIQICQNGANWVWVDVKMVRDGGAGSRVIGELYRTPVPTPVAAVSDPPRLTGQLLLKQGALLGRLIDGSCLIEDLAGNLILLRPGRELEVITRTFAIPRITSDGRGMTWLEQEGNCRECIELGPGVPFGRLVWWRLDGTRLTAQLDHPQIIHYLPSPDGKLLTIGHWDSDGATGGIGVLGPTGFQPEAFPARGGIPTGSPGSPSSPGSPGSPARLPSPGNAPSASTSPMVPVGWIGTQLLTQRTADLWRSKSPIFRAEDGVQIAEWLDSGGDGSLLILLNDEVHYLTPDGRAYVISDPAPHLTEPTGGHVLGKYQPQALYVTLADGNDLLMIRYSSPRIGPPRRVR